jgi:hypothetical protein
MPDVARAIGAALGKTVTYVTVPLDVALNGMRAHGLSEAVVTAYGAMMQGMATLGPKVSAEPRTAETTTPTTIEVFARTIFAPAVTAVPTGASIGHAV